MKQGSNQAIRFFVMETCKDWYRGGDSKKSVPKLVVGAFGAVAGAASVFGNTPIDVVKTRMQVSNYFFFLQIILNAFKKTYFRDLKPQNTKILWTVSSKFGKTKARKRKFNIFIIF